MKIAIIYCSKYGTTEKICRTLISQLPDTAQAKLFCLDQSRPDNLTEYDVIVLGTPIYAGKPRQRMTEFCDANIGLLLQKRLILFVCGMDRGHAIKEIETTYPQNLISHSSLATFIEGEYLLDRMRLADRLILRIFFKVKASQTRDYTEEARILTDKIIAR